MKGSNTMHYTSTNGITYILYSHLIYLRDGKISKIYTLYPEGRKPKDPFARIVKELPADRYINILPSGVPTVCIKK